jgi:peptidoglycan/xylan/chitin deacetylase (PgdA/CDA1 family)
LKSLLILSAKQAAAICMYRSGLLAAWWRRFGHRDGLIFTYHRVLDSRLGTDYSQPGIVVSAAIFESQIACLKKWFRILPLSRFAGSEPPGQDAAAVTFDDGWADNLRFAMPILAKHGVAPTLFLACGFIGTGRWFWPERLIRALGRSRGRPAAEAWPDPIRKAWAALDAGAGRDRGAAVDRLIEALKQASEAERSAVLADLEAAASPPPEGEAPPMLDWDQVAALAEAGWEIGSHTMEHHLLPFVPRERALAEIADSRRVLQAKGYASETFAYPNGDWTPDLAGAVRDAGYRLAVSTESPFHPRREAPADLEAFRLPRKHLSEGSSRGPFGFSESVFACHAMGFFDWLGARGRS